MAVMSAMKISNIQEIPIELCRQGLANMMAFSLPPLGCRIQPVNAGGVDALWVAAAPVKDGATILYFHGGAYSMGSAQTHIGLTGMLSEFSGVRILSIDYRLAPEHPFPAAIEDAICAYQWLLNQGVPAKAIVMGVIRQVGD